MAKDPTEVIRKAVLRMLPRNKLRDVSDLLREMKSKYPLSFLLVATVMLKLNNEVYNFFLFSNKLTSVNCFCLYTNTFLCYIG